MKVHAVVIAFCLSASLKLAADPANPVEERWVLADDKSTVLKTLTPGTDDYFFYHALYQQHQGNREAYLKHIQAWEEKLRKNQESTPERLRQLENRQALLNFESDNESLKRDGQRHLTNYLDLTLHHDKPLSREEIHLPSSVDADKISAEAFEKNLVGHLPSQRLRQMTTAKLRAMVASERAWDQETRKTLLGKVKRADIPGMEKLLQANFSDERNELKFEDVACHRNLTAPQLDALSKQFPQLLQNKTFVKIRLERLRGTPSQELDMRRNPEKLIAWLEKVDEFTQTLPPHFNTLKAETLHHLLRCKADADEYPLDLFVRYLTLPRPPAPIWRTSTKVHEHVVKFPSGQLANDCLPSVHNESSLLEKYLDHILTDKVSQDRIAPYFESDYFRKRTAMASIQAGMDYDKDAISPKEYVALRDEASLSIASSSKNHFLAEDQVSLNLDLKNIDQLTVSIYQLDSLNYALKNHEMINLSLDLGGLSPNISRKIDFDQDPLLKHRHTLALPELKGVGSWIVKLQGNSQSATALILKGELHSSVRDTGSGQEIFVTDFQGQALENIEVHVDSKKYTTDAKGIVVLPYATYSKRSQVILHQPNKETGTGRTRIVTVYRKSARQELQLSSIAHPEQWLSGQTAKIYLRPSFLINNKLADLNYLSDTRITLEGILEDESKIRLTKIENPSLSAYDYLPVQFHVPENLNRIDIQMEAVIKPPHLPVETPINTELQLATHSSTDTQKIAHGYFQKTPNGWTLSILGLNGEPFPGHDLTLSFKHKHFTRQLELGLRTDKSGVIQLGSLEDIESVSLENNSTHASCKLNLSSTKYISAKQQYASDKDIELQLASPPSLSALSYSLTSIDNQKASYFANLALAGEKLLIKKLPEGEYRLQVEGFEPLSFHVVAATRHGAWATHQGCSYEIDTSSYPVIADPKLNKEHVEIQVANYSKDARVHLVASRFSDNSAAMRPNLPASADMDIVRFGFYPSTWNNGGTLSSEQQYIITRRNAPRRLGNMLPKPTWHLQPWESNKISEFNEYYEDAEDGNDSGRGSASFGRKGKGKSAGSLNPLSSDSPLTFLAHPAVVLCNLKPNEQGKLSINLKRFRHHSRLDIIVTDGVNSTSRQIALPASLMETRDQRLLKTLDTAKHFKSRQTRAVLKPGEKVEIENILHAKWKAYSSLSNVWSYFHTHANSQEFRETINLLTPALHWPKLEQQERLALLETAGGFELHLFIKNRDPEWFDKHVRPMLANKRRKAFIDHYLLDHDLAPYLELAKYQNLNVIEKALLAHKLPGKNKEILEHLEMLHWRSNPSPEVHTELFTSLLRQEMMENAQIAVHTKTGGSLKLRKKLSQITIPVVDFNNVSVEEAVDFIRLRSRELDKSSFDGTDVGLNITVKKLTTVRGDYGDTGGFGYTSNPGSKKIDNLQLRNVPMQVLLDQICKKTGLRYRIEDHGVVLLPATDVDDAEIFSRSFKVPPDFMTLMGDGGGSEDSFDGSSDPFSSPSNAGSGLRATPPAKELLEKSGITFPEGATATFDKRTGMLTIRNTATNLDLINQLTQSLRESPARSKTARIYKRKSDSPSNIQPTPQQTGGSHSDDPFSTAGESIQNTLRGRFPVTPATPLYDSETLPNETKAYLEANYLRHSQTSTPLNVPINRFWLDLAAWDGKSSFLSPHFAECRYNVHEALIALAFLDLDFEGQDIDSAIEQNTLSVTAKQPTLLYYQDTIAVEKTNKDNSLLASLRYFLKGDEFTVTKEGKKKENSIQDDQFHSRAIYNADLIITNPTGLEREVEILRQIPAGAIRIDSNESLESTKTLIPPHGSHRQVISFYFPAAGEYTHYTPEIYEDHQLAVGLSAKSLKVSADPKPEVTDSWYHIATNGSDQELLTALRTRQFQPNDFDDLGWRLADRDLYLKVVEILRARKLSAPAVEQFAFRHYDSETVSTYLAKPDHFSNQFGSYFVTQLANISPYTDGRFEDTEWRPLVKTRSYQLRDNLPISQIPVWDDYLDLLSHLIWMPALGNEEKLTMVYHLFSHERDAEALQLLNTCERSQTEAKMQWDYLKAYALFSEAKPEEAVSLAKQWMNKSTPQWDQRFQSILDQVEEIKSASLMESDWGQTEKSQDQQWSAQITPDHQLVINHDGLEQLTLKVYPIDLEFLFTATPFLEGQNQVHTAVLPAKTMVIHLDKKEKISSSTLPEEFKTGNKLLVLEGTGSSWVQTLQSSTLVVTPNKGRGLLQASANGKPLAKTYIKIYAETNDGEVVYYKDGHTDLRGMFDYRSHNEYAPADIRKFAIYADHEQHGARTIEIK
ncbi:hypothetical protein Rhal01_01182 [Rubritalea halochordaticola]|uniref:Uncharacterized protein n=1 Tax=Rubritalea halochordaticola TaxID=714537 RepID=A0ABP9UXB6_9BACT